MPGENNTLKKRDGIISWDECFMQMCFLIAQRSKDPNTQQGACIVNENNIVVGLGYNGFPRGCDDDKFPWTRNGEYADKKYAYVVHSEVNAIYNASRQPKDCRLYCTMYPCNECAKAIIQNGIKEVIYESDFYHDDPIWKASRKLLEGAKVKCRQFTPKYKLKLE
ncbi:MAG: dCMP deaminase family protein [Candidatus Kuenenbacteria bacterium]